MIRHSSGPYFFVLILLVGLALSFEQAKALYVKSDARAMNTTTLDQTPLNERPNHGFQIPYTGSPGTQRNINRDHNMKVEMISVGPNGFQPTSLTRPSLRFLLAINNRSGLEELSIQLMREDGTLMQEARVNSKQPNWRSLVSLPPGTYRLIETSHKDWICTIVITAHR